MFALLWAAAERVGAQDALVIQSQNPTHYALDAVARQELAAFYRHEIKFRAELGYPPFRRLAVVTVSGGDTADATGRRGGGRAPCFAAPRPSIHRWPSGASGRGASW